MELNKIVPPIIKEVYKNNLSRYGWFGDYLSWDMAIKKSKGYSSNLILEKVKSSLQEVKEGKAIYERDSVLFDKIEYSPVILAGLLLAKKNNSLSVLDFGGSLGSTYFQNRSILNELDNVKWSIVEQSNFVKVGKKKFSDNKLKFYNTISECKRKENPSALLLSSTIQYLEKPYLFLKEILEYKFQYILIDRTPFVKTKDRLTIQRVNPKIYNASYPCWFFNERRFLNMFNDKYEVVAEFVNPDKSNIKSRFKGFLLKIK